MLSYLEKFNNLPKETRDKVKSPEVGFVIEELENKYKVRLASAIMKIAVGEVSESELDNYLKNELALREDRAKELADEIRGRIIEQIAKKEEAPALTEVAGEIKADEPLMVKGSNFFFSPDDEEEIRSLVKKINVPEAPKPEDIKEKVAKAFDELQINFGSEFLSDRFKKIIETYLKGIRNRLETKATMQKPFELGGLGFDEESLAKILDVLDKYKADKNNTNVVQPKKFALPEDDLAVSSLKNSGVRDVDYDFSALVAKKQENNETKKSARTTVPSQNDIVGPESGGQESKEAVKQENNKTAEWKNEVKNVKEVEKGDKNLSIPPIRFAEAPGKIKMHDIRAPKPKIMTPVDELKYLDLVNFRRLSRESLLKAKDKIKEKVRLLGEESYDKRVEGIKAWRSSPVNKLYLQIGEESISKNEPIDVIIEERKARGDEYLTNTELEAIMDLNKELRF